MGGLWRLAAGLPDTQLELWLHNHLDFFQDSPGEFGYRILHNESLTHNHRCSSWQTTILK